MKAVVGIDDKGTYSNAIALFARLEFENPSAELIHVEELLPLGGIGMAPYTYMNYQLSDSLKHVESDRLLEAAKQTAGSAGLNATTLTGVGNPCEILDRRADEVHADLIVVGSNHASAYAALLFGSVGRGLTISAHHSFLIAKNPLKHAGKLTAIFATDCSQFSEECLQILARMHPKGIGKLLILTAAGFVDQKPPVEVSRKIESFCAHMRMEGIECKGVIVEGEATEAIDQEMEEQNADLLILSARGHGVLERLLIGSLSLREVVASGHSLLILRSAHD